MAHHGICKHNKPNENKQLNGPSSQIHPAHCESVWRDECVECSNTVVSRWVLIGNDMLSNMYLGATSRISCTYFQCRRCLWFAHNHSNGLLWTAGYFNTKRRMRQKKKKCFLYSRVGVWGSKLRLRYCSARRGRIHVDEPTTHYVFNSPLMERKMPFLILAGSGFRIIFSLFFCISR